MIIGAYGFVNEKMRFFCIFNLKKEYDIQMPDQGVTMSEYRRFFSYIYAYEQNKKTSNAGFAKIEMRGSVTSIELHLRNISLSLPSACLYLFVRDNDSIVGFPLGDVPFSGGTADRRFTLNQKQLGESNYTITDVSGILLFTDERICFVSQWDEAAINWDSFHIYQPKTPEIQTETKDPSPEDKVIQSAELPLPQLQAPVSTGSWQEIWQDLLLSQPVMQPFSNTGIRCIRIGLKDLRILPPANWHLCNNSFLLHAFFTYRHLLIGEIPSAKEPRWFIGIPGTHDRQEHVLAAMFGFSDFLPEKNVQSEERPFGYWCTPMVEAD